MRAMARIASPSCSRMDPIGFTLTLTLTRRRDAPGNIGVITRHCPQRVAQLLAHGRVRERLRLVAAPGVLQRRHLSCVVKAALNLLAVLITPLN